MAENNLVGYKKVFGLVLPEWVDEKRLNLTLGIFMLSLVMYFISFLVIAPNKETLDKNMAMLETERTSLKKVKEAMNSVEETKKSFSEQDFNRVLKAMPNTYSPEEAVFSIRNIANLSGVFLEGYTLPAGVIIDNTKTEMASSKKNNQFQQFVIGLNVRGPVDNLLNFITSLETSLPVGFVSDLNIQELAKASNLKNDSSVNLKLEITYYQPQVFKFSTAEIEAMGPLEKDLMQLLTKYYDPFEAGVFGFSASDLPATSGDRTGVIKNIFGY